MNKKQLLERIISLMDAQDSSDISAVRKEHEGLVAVVQALNIRLMEIEKRVENPDDEDPLFGTTLPRHLREELAKSQADYSWLQDCYEDLKQVLLDLGVTPPVTRSRK